jgi:hypothetical protein
MATSELEVKEMAIEAMESKKVGEKEIRLLRRRNSKGLIRGYGVQVVKDGDETAAVAWFKHLATARPCYDAHRFGFSD